MLTIKLLNALAGLFFMPASTMQPLAVAEKLLSETPLPLHSSQAMLPPSDPLFAKHWVLLQDVGAPDMDDARLVVPTCTWLSSSAL
jgi:hypothetical protein